MTATCVAAQLALHRYWMWANTLRAQFHEMLKTDPPSPDPAMFADKAPAFMSHWYAALYVVVEGWRELGLFDASIDALLQPDRVDLLRRYRNGVCHFQPTYFDDRFTALAADTSTPAWVIELNREFGRWFLEQSRARATRRRPLATEQAAADE